MNGVTKYHLLMVITSALTACGGDARAVEKSSKDDVAGISAVALAAGAFLGSDIPASSSMVGWGNYQVDSNWYGPGFNIAGVHYTKGIFAHAPSRVTFPLNGAYMRLSGCVGHDDGDGNCGNGSQVSVYSGNTLLWSSHVGNQSLVCMPLLSMSGVVELVLVADDLGDRKCDEVEWVNMLVQ